MAQGNKPDFVVTGRQGGDNKRWTPCGAAWKVFAQETGNPYLSVRVQSIPINWDGTLALHEANGREPGDEG
jgi:uncharacterized protein (DUF736 family)